MIIIKNAYKDESKKLGQRNNPMQFRATSSLLHAQ